MEDTKFYEFLLRLTTYLNRTNILAEKFTIQEQEIGLSILAFKHAISTDIFDSLVIPIANKFEERLKLMGEIREANNEFEKTLHEYYAYFKGTVQ